MAFKFVILVCLVSVAFGGLLPTYIPPAQSYLPPSESYLPPATTKAPEWQPEAEKPANYEFQYEVNEPSTGDIKQQQEMAKDGVVKGQYWLIQPDGSKRIVDYTADDKNGFQATVKIIPAEPGWKPAAQPAPWKPEPQNPQGYYY